ncbi:PREDICTED: nuclear polyadenylated RNA-binding protein 3-like [Ipomoea nil]|uniref:nuclear polyadenylated RNA-binding protein 3-like n=1 Tax=Ipomoea nil TaxID=35883 RepID=UPI0009017FF1|nr:PREDICTED: nuclear polyadenylated RNA-binding protein 3-like [Ipomoea nil]
MLLSKIKTALEKSHQNDPNCEVSGSKDENGKEISDESDKEKEDEEDANSDDADADDENDDDDDDGNDDNQNGGNTNHPHQDHNASNPEESSSHNSPSRSDDKREASLKDDNTSHTQPEDLSRALVSHVQPMDETPIKREDEISREDKMDASPVFISSASGGKMEAPSQAEQMDTSPTNIEEESPPVSPHHVMNLMRETVHTAEMIHREYLTLRQKDTQILEDLSKKVDHLMAAQAQSRPPPQEQPQPPPQAPPEQHSNIHLAKELHELHASVDKVAKQQHELKHSHFSLKGHVDLACTKMETAHDNAFQMGQYLYQILGYVQDTLIAVNKLSTPPSTCADDAKKGGKEEP